MSIKYISTTVKDLQPYRILIDDISKGAIGIVEGGQKYLPKENNEKDTGYNARLAKATFIDIYNPTVNGLSGLVFKKPIVYGDDIPAQLQPLIENADLQGNHFDILIERLFKIALHKGISFAMVDAPKGKAKSKKEERQLGLKPYISIINPEDITSWKTETRGGQLVLTQIKIREFVEVDDDKNPYATVSVEQYRVLEIGKYTVYQEKDKADVIVDEGVTGLSYIPLVAININAKGFFEAFPTFYDLAKLNIAHYQIFSDSRHSAHIASVPMLKLLGFDKSEIEKLTVSANTALATHNTEAKVEWLDYDGKGVAVNNELLNRLEQKMNEIGLAVISDSKELTATEVQIATTQKQSKLNSYVRALIDGVELLLKMAGGFYGLDEGGSVDIDADILSQPLSVEEVVAYNNMVLSGNMSVETLWTMLASSKRLPPDFDTEAEKERISSEGLLSNDTDA